MYRLEAIVRASGSESGPEAAAKPPKPAQGQHGAGIGQGKAVAGMLADLAYWSRFLDAMDCFRKGGKSNGDNTG